MDFLRQIFCGEHIYKTISSEQIREEIKSRYIFDVEVERHHYVVLAFTLQCVKCGKTIIKEQYKEKE